MSLGFPSSQQGGRPTPHPHAAIPLAPAARHGRDKALPPVSNVLVPTVPIAPLARGPLCRATSLSTNSKVGLAYAALGAALLSATCVAYVGDDTPWAAAAPALHAGEWIALWAVLCSVYASVDVCYQFAVERRVCAALMRRAGHVESLQRRYLLAVWLAAAGLANLHLAVVPALETGTYRPRVAAFNGAVLGAYGYGTLGLGCAWSYESYPLACAAVYVCSGIAFNAISAVVAGYVAGELAD